jgi:hypothetical protein
MRYYQLHHKRRHLQIYDLTCETCGLGFWTRSQLQSHRCFRDRREINIKKRQILASRAQAQLQQMAVPYYVVLNKHSECHVRLSSKQHRPQRGISTSVIGFATRPSAGVTQNVVSDGEIVFRDMSVSCSEQGFPAPVHVTPVHQRSGQTDDVFSASDAPNPATQFEVGKDSVIASEETLDKPADDAHIKQWPMATVTGAGKLICAICKKYIRMQNYHPHMRRVHGIESNRMRPIAWKVCERCGYKCQDNYKFRRHQMTHDGHGKYLFTFYA